MHEDKYQFQSMFTFEIACVNSRIHDWQIVNKLKIALGSVIGVAAACAIMRYIEMQIQPAIVISLGFLPMAATITLLSMLSFGKKVIGIASKRKDNFSFMAKNNEMIWSAKMEDGSEQKFILHKGDCLITKEQRGPDTFYVFSGKAAPSLALLFKREISDSTKELCYKISGISLYVCADEIESKELRELLESRCLYT